MNRWWNVFKRGQTTYFDKTRQPASLLQKSLLDVDLTSKHLLKDYQIRAANYKDLRYFVWLQQQGYDNYVAWQEEDFLKDWDTNPGLWYIVLVERQTNTLIGLCTGRVLNQKAHLSQLIIHPNYQQQGLGQQLFKVWLEGLLAINTTRITLEVRASNQKARYFYEKFGLQVIALKKNYYPTLNDDAYIMEWKKGTT